MTHKDAILSLLNDLGLSKHELASRCGYAGGLSSIDPRLRSDIRLSTLRRLAEALSYEVALIPKEAGQPVYVLDEDLPVEELCRTHLGYGKPGPVPKKPRKNKKGSWSSDDLLKQFGMEEI